MQPDLSIYPNLPSDTSYGFLTRGCPNKCGWCVVPKKEGNVHPYWDVDRVANGRNNLILMDNNILGAGDYAVEQFEKIISRGYKVDFNQALDARLVTDQYAKLLAKMKWVNTIRLGCDTKAQIEHCDRAIEMISSYGYKKPFFLYTMLHGDFMENYERVNHYRKMLMERRRTHKGYSTYPNCQPYRDFSNPNFAIPKWQSDMARWCNNRALFGSMEFTDYEPRKGFKCQTYIDEFYGRICQDT